MSISRSDLLFYGGGAALQKFGTLSRRTTTINRRGEGMAEVFTRSGTGCFLDGNGVLRSAATNVPRVNHWADGARLSTPRLVLEAARTNGWTYSEQLNNAAWTKTNCTISADAVVAPDGTTTMDHVVESATSAEHYISRVYGSVTADTNQSASCFAKAGTRTWLRITTIDATGTEILSTWVNLSTGVVGTSDSGHAITVEDFGSGTYRISVVFNANDAAPYEVTVRFALATQDNETSYSGNGTSGAYLWGLQFEADKSFSSSYIKTVASTATRNDETLSFPFWTPPCAVSIYVKFTERQIPNWTADRTIMALSDTSLSTPYLRIRKITATDRYHIAHRAGGSGVTSYVDLNPSVGDVVEVCGLLNSNGSVQLFGALNGGSISTGSASGGEVLGSAWSGPLLNVGGYGANNVGFSEFEALICCRGSSYSIADFRAILP